MVRQAPVICVMVPPIHLGAWSMALMLWLPFDIFLVQLRMAPTLSLRFDKTILSALRTDMFSTAFVHTGILTIPSEGVDKLFF